ELIGLNISSKIYIKGAGASTQRAKDLTKAASKFFANKNINGVSVSFNINYSYNESIQKDDLNEGDNILEFSAEPGGAKNRSHVVGSIKESLDRYGNSTLLMGTGRTGTIYGSGKDNYT